MRRFSILTLFPEMFAPLEHSIVGRGEKQGLLSVEKIQIRDFAPGKHRQVDDSPFGGGPGMVMKPDVMAAALAHAKQRVSTTSPQADPESNADQAPQPSHVVYMSPQGKRFDQQDASRLAEQEHLILICGHYEGIDERFITHHVDEELSIGDFVLTGGELPAMVVVDAVSRMIPGVLGDAGSAEADSFQTGLLDHPHYTRPALWAMGEEESQLSGVPDVLRSGNHGAIEGWRRRQALLRTLIRRPDLVAGAPLSKAERRLITALAEDLEKQEPS
uniref:tRNA (guanine-N(1)-)-methyltransferase n=1 Tax=Magnetococcus massalia (strain MO-1) TaxID=451514 RepID=A0A1S7LQT6_MAGMO|nr:tRNA (Guanine-N(1)-)-methyltransferase [Candidatus Magnetococcus massalia]